jgi:hypothetical protein
MVDQPSNAAPDAIAIGGGLSRPRACEQFQRRDRRRRR